MDQGGSKKVDIAYDAIKELVRDCRLRPGEHIQIGDLSHRLNVGVTPIREALFKLKAENFICSDGKRGFASKPINLDEMRELHEIARVVLVHVVHRARLPDAAWTALIEGMGEILPDLWRISATSNVPTPAELRFASRTLEGIFASLAALTGNVELSRIVQNFNDKSHFVRLIDLRTKRHRQELAEYVKRLLRALEGQRPHEVAKLIEVHFDRIDDRMDALIREALVQSHGAPRARLCSRPCLPTRSDGHATPNCIVALS